MLGVEDQYFEDLERPPERLYRQLSFPLVNRVIASSIFVGERTNPARDDIAYDGGSLTMCDIAHVAAALLHVLQRQLHLLISIQHFLALKFRHEVARTRKPDQYVHLLAELKVTGDVIVRILDISATTLSKVVYDGETWQRVLGGHLGSLKVWASLEEFCV